MNILRLSAATTVVCGALGAGGFVFVAPSLIAASTTPIRADAAPSSVAYESIPPELLDRYVLAGETCAGLPWQIVAAIGAIESGHGTYGGSVVDPSTGDVQPPIIGPALDGRPGFAAIRDASEPDGWAHAHGPMQFLRTTWTRWATPGVGRPAGVVPDMDNAWDAIATAAAFLCGGKDEVGDMPAAIRKYNNSQEYVDAVMAKAIAYGMGSTDPDVDPFDVGGSVDSDTVKAVLEFALAQLGKPYVWGGEGPAGFDCSGLTKAAFRTIGVDLPHNSTAQARYGASVALDDVRAGDLVFTRGGKPTHDLGHVGIAIDDENYIVAPKTGDAIKITAIPYGRVQAVRRLAPAAPASEAGAGRWTTTVVHGAVSRSTALTLARDYFVVVATPEALPPHLGAMKAVKPGLEVLAWVGIPVDTDLTRPETRAALVQTCQDKIDDSGYDGCLYNDPPRPDRTPGALWTDALRALLAETNPAGQDGSVLAALNSDPNHPTVTNPTEPASLRS